MAPGVAGRQRSAAAAALRSLPRGRRPPSQEATLKYLTPLLLPTFSIHSDSHPGNVLSVQGREENTEPILVGRP